MKASLKLGVSQHLTLTPQLQQSIRFLQLSTLELEQEVHQLIQTNPLLEIEEVTATEEPQAVVGEEFSLTEVERAGSTYDDEFSFENKDTKPLSLYDHIEEQISLLRLNENEKALLLFLADSLDENGYLTTPLSELRTSLPEPIVVDEDELNFALKCLQSLEPAGIGARNLEECLLLQLKTLPQTLPGYNLAVTLVKSHLNLLASKDFAQINRKANVDDSQLALAVNLLMSLNPRPGSSFSDIENHYVAPDVIVRQVNGQWRATINPDVVPKVRINDMYARVLREQKSASTLHSQLQEARWVVQNIEQRFTTILAVSQAIVERQKDFFTYGEMAMQPLVLREIAAEIGMHESTISRVSNQKYLSSPRGVFELKYFFSSHVATSEGGMCSATAIRAVIKKLVEKEDPQKPLSDAKIADLLANEGMIVARRTIAKYREALHIPPASQRKKLR